MPTEFSTLASKCLQELMDRHGGPRHKQAGVVTAVLGLSCSHGNHKLRRLAPMTFDEVGRIAGHFGETLSQALEPSLAHGLEHAVMMVVELEVPCEVMLGELLQPPFANEKVVAVGVPGSFLVVPATAVGVPGSFLVVPATALSRPAWRVRRLLLRLEQSPVRAG